MSSPLKIFFMYFAVIFLLFGCGGKDEKIVEKDLDEQPRPPIIDMHMHTFQWDVLGDPPPPNQVTGVVPPARTDREAMEAYLEDMERYNIVKAVGFAQLEMVKMWASASPERIIGGIQFPNVQYPGYPKAVNEWPDIELLRAEYELGNLAVMGEITAQYSGVAPNDPQLEPYFALAEELDIPVCIHCALGPPGAPYGSHPKLRAAIGNPLLLEDVLIRHPRLRIYIAHAGHPYLDETKAIMWLYPNVYTDISVINWLFPRDDFYDYLESLIRSGFGKRIMYGSDQMIWPDAVGLSIESIESADFLSEEQKRDIFYNNAARFLRLEEAH